MKYRDPITQRYISEATFYARLFEYGAERETLADEVDNAADRYLNANTRRKQSYWLRRLDDARQALNSYGSAVANMEYQVEAVEQARERRRQRRAPKPKPKPKPEAPPRMEPKPKPKKATKAQEWEFGKDYKSPRRGGHDVSVNVRLVFDKPVTQDIARRAMKEFIDGGEPEGVQIEGVDWRTRRGTKEGEARDFDNFRNIMYAEGVDYLRAGAVKLDLL